MYCLRFVDAILALLRRRGRRWGGALKAGSPALGAMSSVAGSGGGLGAQKQYSPCRNLWEEGSFLEPPSWGLGAAATTVPSQ